MTRPRPEATVPPGPHVGAMATADRSDLPRAILDHSKAIVYVKDLLGRYVFINRRFEEVLQVRAEDLLGRTDDDLYPRATADVVRANDRRVMSRRAAEEIEEFIPVPGSARPRVFVSIKEPLFDAEGEPYALCGVSTDITEWKRVEESLRLSEERHRTLVEATAAIVWSTPASGEFEAEQPGWSAFTGQTFAELRGWGWLDAIHPDDRDETALVWGRAVASRGLYQVEHRVRRREGCYRDMSARAVPILALDGSIREWMGVHVDVTERKAAEAALQESRLRHAASLAASGTGTYRWEIETGALDWDDQLKTLFGVPLDCQPTFDEAMRRIHPDDQAELNRRLEVSQERDVGEPIEFRVLLIDGDVRWLRTQGRTFRDADGRVSHMIGGCIDVTKLKLAEQRLSHLANHDPLTGLPNRNLLQAVMDSLVAAKSTATKFAFLLLDLDRFKEINDTFGHDHGDAVLREMNPRLSDVVGGNGLIARLGGDEFGILLGGADRAEAEARARAILAAVARPIFAHGKMLEVGASVGVALYPDHGHDAPALMRLADLAMYDAKRSRTGWTVYQAEPGRCALDLACELRQALEHGRLVPRYQPVIDLRTMRDAGAEALVRWRHPREGMVGPDVLVPLAEENGLSRALSVWTLNRALRDLQDLDDPGADFSIAVNLAPAALLDLSLAAAVLDLLRAHQTPARRLTIEVSEAAVMKNPPRARAVLLALQESGVRIRIDDFGAGYSSLAYLKELPMDEIKIARAFVKDAAASERDAGIVRSVIDLGRNLGLRVVAEGVEDEVSLGLLRSWGCDLAQGPILSRPLPAEVWRRRLRRPAAPAPPQSAVEEAGGGLGARPWGARRGAFTAT